MMRAVLRLPGFRHLFAGLVTSIVGDSLMLLVFAIWVKKLTGSNGAAGLVMLFLALPYLVAPLGGWLVDRFRRRSFLVVANVVSAFMLLPLLAVRDRGDIWVIYVVAALYGISSVGIAAALNGLLKDLVADELLAEANGVLQTVKEGLRLGGPLAGAALFVAFGGVVVAAIDAVTFLVAAVAIGLMRLREDPPKRTELNWLGEMTAGIRHITAERALRRIVTAGAAAMLVIGINESVVFAVVDQGLHRPPEFVAVLSSAMGAGAIVGGLVAGRLINRIGELGATAIGLAAFGSGSALWTLPTVPLVLAGAAVAGSGIPVAIVGLNTVLQRRTPAPLVGRVSTAAETLLTGPQTISIAAGAALVSLVNYRLLLAVVFVGVLAAAAYLWLGRRLTVVETVEVPVVQPSGSA